MQRRWTALDLDNTLHAFRDASHDAMEAVFDVVQQHTSVDEYDLKEFYRGLVDDTCKGRRVLRRRACRLSLRPSVRAYGR